MNPEIGDNPTVFCKCRRTNSICLLNSPSLGVDRMYDFLRMKMRLASYSQNVLSLHQLEWN